MLSGEDGLFAVKRPVLSAQLLIDDKVDVSGSPNIRLVPTLAPEPVAKQKVDAPSTATASDKSPKTAPQAAQAPKQASPTPTQQASDKTPKKGVKQSSVNKWIACTPLIKNRVSCLEV